MTNIAVELLQRIKAHLLAQGRKATDGAAACQYRTASGLTCAVGCLIPKEFYNPKSEGAGLQRLVIRDGTWHAPELPAANIIALAEMLNAAGVPASGVVQKALMDAQSIHDCTFVTTWERDMNRLIENVKGVNS